LRYPNAIYKVCVSFRHHEQTIGSSPTVCVPGKVCSAAIIFPAEPAVVTISNGFSTETLDLSPASKVPAVMTTASSAFTPPEV
jgi:hypothetical protein